MFRKIQTYFRRGWMVKLPSPEHSYALMMNRFNNNQPFAFSRWGDGEWEAVLDLKQENDANCDGHQYFASLKDALREILSSNPPYMLGMQKLAYHKLIGREIDSYLKQNNITTEWLNADAFHDASSKGQLTSFFDFLRHKKVLLIGPLYLRKLEVFRFDLCEVPEKNCWLERDKILQQIKNKVAANGYDVMLFCAGMTSNWFIDQMYGSFRGFIIDVGSLLDPYAGRHTRNYHKKLAGNLFK